MLGGGGGGAGNAMASTLTMQPNLAGVLQTGGSPIGTGSYLGSPLDPTMGALGGMNGMSGMMTGGGGGGFDGLTQAGNIVGGFSSAGSPLTNAIPVGSGSFLSRYTPPGLGAFTSGVVGYGGMPNM